MTAAQSNPPDACAGEAKTLAQLATELQKKLTDPLSNAACIQFLRALIADLEARAGSFRQWKDANRYDALKASFETTKGNLECVLGADAKTVAEIREGVEAAVTAKAKSYDEFLGALATAKANLTHAEKALAEATGKRDGANGEIESTAKKLTAFEARLKQANDDNKRVGYFHWLESHELWEQIQKPPSEGDFIQDAIAHAIAVRQAEENLAAAKRVVSQLEALEKELKKELETARADREKNTIAKLKEKSA